MGRPGRANPLAHPADKPGRQPSTRGSPQGNSRACRMASDDREFCHGAQEFLPDTPKLSPDVRKSLPDARELRSDAAEFCPSTAKMSLATGSFIGVPRSLARGHPRSVPVHGTFVRTSPSSTRASPRLIRGNLNSGCMGQGFTVGVQRCGAFPHVSASLRLSGRSSSSRFTQQPRPWALLQKRIHLHGTKSPAEARSLWGPRRFRWVVLGSRRGPAGRWP